MRIQRLCAFLVALDRLIQEQALHSHCSDRLWIYDDIYGTSFSKPAQSNWLYPSFIPRKLHDIPMKPLYPLDKQLEAQLGAGAQGTTQGDGTGMFPNGRPGKG